MKYLFIFLVFFFSTNAWTADQKISIVSCNLNKNKELSINCRVQNIAGYSVIMPASISYSAKLTGNSHLMNRERFSSTSSLARWSVSVQYLIDNKIVKRKVLTKFGTKELIIIPPRSHRDFSIKINADFLPSSNLKDVKALIHYSLNFAGSELTFNDSFKCIFNLKSSFFPLANAEAIPEKN